MVSHMLVKLFVDGFTVPIIAMRSAGLYGGCLVG